MDKEPSTEPMSTEAKWILLAILISLILIIGGVVSKFGLDIAAIVLGCIMLLFIPVYVIMSDP